MNSSINSSIFIPILSIPNLMGVDNSKFFKEYSFLKIDTPEPRITNGPIESKLGRAIIDVVIRPEIKKTLRLKKNNKRVEQVIVRALIDTGAQISAINKDKVKELKEKTFKGAIVAGLNKEATQGYNTNVSIHLFNRSDGFIDLCPLVVDFYDEYAFDFIIGWDILKYCLLSYDGTSKHFDLKFIGSQE